jgi:ATP-dependent DNA helicase RecG
LEEPVKFNDLQLAIIDEQHRFGVEQRSLLRAKGQSPHLLVMTATPIPRSLALTIYGDLDVSVMDEMPAGRIPVETFVLMPLERERAYNLISKQISEGHQAFIIYPLIQMNEDNDVKAAIEESERLQKEIFPLNKIGLLHGKMKTDEKESVMQQFRNNDLQILVSTSVIEVGVDIPNATVMLIEGADRFGLAQLHQFRGRVGRGGNKSFCLLIPNMDDSVENQRLTVMTQTNDGFFLAEKDLELRGPGDFLGDRQSGFIDLKMAKLTDIHLIEKARTFAQEIFATDPDLSNSAHTLLRESLLRFWQHGTGDIS